MPRAKKSPDPQAWNRPSQFVTVLQVEMNRLSKKTPREPISDLAVTRINRAIRDTKGLVAGEGAYVEDLSEFVPAGENPEARDALLVLSELKSSLEQLGETHELIYRL
ncbi:MAG: hypothetical protein M3451_07540 [Chloroflexota bacterium]|nr:hypothetical protein [Chloroflexota bacterium]